MLADIKKRFGAMWVRVGDHDARKYLIRCVSPDEIGIYTTGDIEIVGKREWEGWA